MVEEGKYVTVGDVLANLDDEKIAVQLAQAKANLKKLENNYQRNEKLHKKSLISTEVFQQVKYEYEHQKATYDLAELDLNHRRATIGFILLILFSVAVPIKMIKTDMFDDPENRRFRLHYHINGSYTFYRANFASSTILLKKGKEAKKSVKC